MGRRSSSPRCINWHLPFRIHFIRIKCFMYLFGFQLHWQAKKLRWTNKIRNKALPPTAPPATSHQPSLTANKMATTTSVSADGSIEILAIDLEPQECHDDSFVWPDGPYVPDPSAAEDTKPGEETDIMDLTPQQLDEAIKRHNDEVYRIIALRDAQDRKVGRPKL